MKHHCRLIGLILVLLLSFCAFLVANAANFSQEALKTEKKPATVRHFANLRSANFDNMACSQLIAGSGLTFEGKLAKNNTAYQKLYTTLSDAGLAVEQIVVDKNRTIRFMSGDLGKLNDYYAVSKKEVATFADFSLSNAERADVRAVFGWFSKYGSAIGLNKADEELHVKSYSLDELGKRHIKFQQMFKDIPVWAEELCVHIDENDHIYAINGRYEATPYQMTRLEPRLEASRAFEIAKSFLIAEKKWSQIKPQVKEKFNIPEPSIEKVIWFDFSGQPHLVWFVDIYANLRDWFYFFIDAETGQILHHIYNTKSDGFVNASGVDLSNVTRQFRAYQEGATYYMLSDVNELTASGQGGIRIYDFNFQRYGDESADVYLAKSSSLNSWNDRSTVSAIYNARVCYDYYKNTHNRRAIDDQASTIIFLVNVNDEDGNPMDNAFWSGMAVFFGNGQNVLKPVVGALDVTAHEFTHGVTDFTANLIYQFQSGALNEAMSDFFGCMVDRDDWLIGEDITLNALALRDLQNPANPQVLRKLPVNMDQYQYKSSDEDHGGVHTNCGIINRASYLIANSIGREKAEQIYYRALTKYLTRQSEFIDARNALEQSAQDLYGATEVNAVKAAFDEVKITSGTGGYEPDEDNVRPTTGGSQWIAYIRDDLQIGLYNYDQDQDWYLPGLTVRTKTNNSGQIINYSQITATADGKYLYFVNENGKVVQVDLSKLVSDMQFSTFVFDDIWVYAIGDVWNVAVTRDNSMLAFTSVYEDDRNIYFYKDYEMYALELDMPATQEGIEVNTIKYADVLDWSPNCKYPKLAFDAYNEYSLGGNTLKSWWCMGEVDISDINNIQIYSLLPPQPVGYSVGNVEYSSYNPDVIVYNFMDPDNNWDIKITNYDDPTKNRWMTFPDRDVQRPSFSPDDRLLAIDRTTDHKLLILDIETNTFSVMNTITSGVRYSEWFVLNGAFDVKVADKSSTTPDQFCLSQNYPNPFNPSTTIAFTLPRPGFVTLKVYNLLGEEVAALISEKRSAGIHRLNWDARGLASGVYLCRLEVSDPSMDLPNKSGVAGQVLVQSKKLILMR